MFTRRDKILKRLLDVILSMVLLLLSLIPMVLVGMIVKIGRPKGSVVYLSKRVGLDNEPFYMPKFRTMEEVAPELPTHLMGNADGYLTPVGRILRKTSIDELPQLWSVLVGDMSLVGPRPALFNQEELTKMRTQRGVHRLLPGVTGWAQINGRDNISDAEKVEFDAFYMKNMSVGLDVRILWRTVGQVFAGRGVLH